MFCSAGKTSRLLRTASITMSEVFIEGTYGDDANSIVEVRLQPLHIAIEIIIFDVCKIPILSVRMKTDSH